MLAVSFLTWWYGQGWKQVATSFGSRLRAVADSFSVAQLSRTLFAPWRRIITPPGAGLSAKVHALLDNAVSRTIGFMVRLLVLIGALIAAVVVAVLTLVEAVAWPLLPIAVPALIIGGLL